MSRSSIPTNQGIRREHPWERARRLAFARWEAEVRRVPYGHSLPDVVGFAHTIEPPAHWADPAITRRLFAFSALPTGTGPAFLAAVPVRQRRPTEGGLLRLPQPVKRILPAADPAFGELLIEARNGVVPAAWEDILEGVSPRPNLSAIPQLAEQWHLPTSTIETLLLPLVGSLPWHGRPAGLDLFIEVEGWPLARHRSFLTELLSLAPSWVTSSRRRSSISSRDLELVSGVKIRRPPSSVANPFSIRLRAISAPAAPSLRAEAPSRSIITYGHALTSEFEAVLSAGQTVLLLNADEARRIPTGGTEPTDAVRSAVWALRWGIPAPPDGPDWHRWLGDETPRLRHALDSLPIPMSNRPENHWGTLVDRREFRDQLAQTAIARARLRGASEVEETDLAHAVDSLIQAIQRASAWARERRGPLVREIDRTEGARTARLRLALETLLQNRTEGLRLGEAMSALRSQGITLSERDAEEQLERLRIRGLLFQDRSGRYQMV
jgi:hypothetical protein